MGLREAKRTAGPFVLIVSKHERIPYTASGGPSFDRLGASGFRLR